MYVHIVGENLYIYFQFVCCVRSLLFCLLLLSPKMRVAAAMCTFALLSVGGDIFHRLHLRLKSSNSDYTLELSVACKRINVNKKKILCILRNGVIPMNIWIKPI